MPPPFCGAIGFMDGTVFPLFPFVKNFSGRAQDSIWVGKQPPSPAGF
jgi:hypothetical protein